MARSRPRTPATKPPKAITQRAEYERRLVYLHKAFSEHVIDYAQRTLGTTRADSVTDDLLDMFGPLIDALGLSKFLRRMGHAITKADVL